MKLQALQAHISKIPVIAVTPWQPLVPREKCAFPNWLASGWCRLLPVTW